jgi:hypothetical protein
MFRIAELLQTSELNLVRGREAANMQGVRGYGPFLIVIVIVITILLLPDVA